VCQSSRSREAGSEDRKSHGGAEPALTSGKVAGR
jgi:hypothetical protein